MTESVRKMAERLGELVRCECFGLYSHYTDVGLVEGGCPFCDDEEWRLPSEAEVRAAIRAAGWTRLEAQWSAALYATASVIARRNLRGNPSDIDKAVTALGLDASLRAHLWVLELCRA